MSIKYRRKDKTWYYSYLSSIICIAMNVILSYAASKFGLPLYLDTVGTVLVSFHLGPFFGIFTAVTTNLFCLFFNQDSLYYILIGILIALTSAWFVDSEKNKNKLNYIWLVLILAFFGGAIGIVFQWVLVGEPELGYVAGAAKTLAGNDQRMFFIYSLILLFVLNIVDKGISVLISIFVYTITPKSIKDRISKSSWRQHPLTKEQLKKINSANKSVGTSLKIRMAFMLTLAAVAITVILSIVSISTNYESSKEDGRQKVESLTKMTASFVYSDQMDEFMKKPGPVSISDKDYLALNDTLLTLKEGYPDVGYLYIFQVREDASYIIFSTDEKYQAALSVGQKSEYDESLAALVPELISGKKVSTQESTSSYGYYITSLEPIKNMAGNPTNYYVGADIIIPKYSYYLKDYVTKTGIVFSGFFIMILAFGIWLSNYYIAYPIGSLEQSMKRFMNSMHNQEDLDESIKVIQKLDIRTNDEIERLYKILCVMAVSTSEQFRSIRLLSRFTEKMQNGLIITMADMVENRDSDSDFHIQKTSEYVRIIMEGLKRKGYYSEKLTERYISDVQMSAPLYDIGKISIPDSILQKPGKLSDDEFEIMKGHTTSGMKFLENAISSTEGENYLKEARNMAGYHHERWDGKGYPEGLHGQVIPLSARVMAVADVFDALSSPRVYRDAYSFEESVEMIQDGAGTQFDPLVVDAFMDSLSEIKIVIRKYNERVI